MFDAQSRLVLYNQRYCEIFGIAADTISVGMTQEDICAILIAGGCYPASVTLDVIRNSTQFALGHNGGLAVFRELADGRVLSVLYRALKQGGWVSTFEDITEQRQKEARIQHLARHDGLTDLANSRTLKDESRALLAKVPASASMLAMHYLALDRFKFVNDTFGHDTGDELLRAVAARLRELTRCDDRLGRVGGDEFAIMQRVPDAEVAMAFAERLVAVISAPYELSKGRVEIGTSVGVATRCGVVDEVESLLQEADLALRHAKATERGTVCVFDRAMSEAARLRRTLEAELHAALSAEQFEVHYQPLVELEGYRAVGVEALVRWRHPEHGLVSPATFIPVAEEIGLILPLGEWILRRACRDAVTWPANVIVAVNVSCIQIRQKTFAEVVLRILAATGLPAGRLEIEITESALLDGSDIIMQNLHKLRVAGIRFAMDDFGTGYSSLSYLRRFPIDKIKIDRSFMKDTETSADALEIIRAVAGLGLSLGITTLAEGVETIQQLDIARAERIGQVQGFLFSRPQPAEAISAMFRTDAALPFQ